MLYTRSELVDLCSELAPELESLLISLIWHLSRGNVNSRDHYDRFGLLQVPMRLAQHYGVQSELELLEPKTNIRVAIHILRDRGLLELLGREFAGQVHSILGLEQYLNATPRMSRKAR